MQANARNGCLSTSGVKGRTVMFCGEGPPPTAPLGESDWAGLSASVGGAGEEALPSMLVARNDGTGLSASVGGAGGKWHSCLG